jgi:hypothetical protein
MMSIVVKIAGYPEWEEEKSGEERTDLVVEPIGYIECLKGENEPHGIGNVSETTTSCSLLACHADIDEYPKDESRPEFIERFDIERSDGRIEFSTDEKLGERLDGREAEEKDERTS